MAAPHTIETADGTQLVIDPSAETYVAVCSCSWRSLHFTRAGIWRIVTQHLRNVHGDRQAARRAMRAASMAAQRARRRAERDRSTDTDNDEPTYSD